MLKRGKSKMCYFDNDQVQKMRKYFHELDTDKSGMIGPAEIEETLISLGLAKTVDDVAAIVEDLDQDGNGELDFEEFLQMLKDTSMRNCKANYLTDRNLMYEKSKKVETKFPQIESEPYNPAQYV
jgi:Ca2+-binding EF-hand superfamily protein